jgi:dTDP-4-amino-4,6-dideoxygalactose transaminase
MNTINGQIISLAVPVLGDDVKKALCDVIQSGWLTMGDRVKEFESRFAELHGVENAVAVNSCTAGLHLCLAALGIGPGDKVLVPSLTFVATVNAVLYVGATPVFVDIEDIVSPHISIEDAERKYSSAVKAVFVMHYGGYVVDLPEWRAFADAHKIFLIEDAAHAPAVGEVGRCSDAAAFSFFTNKNMTTSEGGMVIARDPSVLSSIRYQRSHGMTSGTLDRQRGHAYSYDVTTLGYNYRMDELRAAMGLIQLERLSKWNKRRRELSGYYRQIIESTITKVNIPFEHVHETSAHLMPVLIPEEANRISVIKKLRENGIQTSIHYPPIHQFSYYKKRFPGVELPKTEAFCARELTLPLHPLLSEDDVKYVSKSLQEAILF